MKFDLIIVLVAFFSVNVYSNMTAVWGQNGQIGTVLLERNTGVAISEQNLEIEFFEERKEIHCRFRAEYHLKNISQRTEDKNLTGLFYSIDGHSIKILHNDSPVIQEIPQERIAQIDSIILSKYKENYWSKTISDEYKLENEYKDQARYLLKNHNNDLKKNAFSISFNSNESNTLVVTGEIKPELYENSFYFTPVESRHYFLRNSKSGFNIASFSYLILPIEQWEYVEKINYKVTVPEKWDITSTIFSSGEWEIPYDRKKFLFNKDLLYSVDSICELTTDYKTDIEKIDNKTVFSGTLDGDSLPPAIRFVLQSRPRIDFLIGGPKIGLGKNHRSQNFTTRFGWESAIEFNHLDLMMSLDYESDFKSENTIAFSVYPMTPPVLIIPTFGAGVGIPYDFQKDLFGVRLLYEASFLFLGIAGAHDYFPENDEWRFSLFGQFTF